MKITYHKMIGRKWLINVAARQGTAVELGVAKGDFAEQILFEREDLQYYGVDRWAGDRNHNDEEYKTALKKLSQYENMKNILRMEFSEAVVFFRDTSIDWIYFDGYAHTGQNEGKTLEEWLPKVKLGGLISGHDFDPKFPKNMECVEAFCAKHFGEMHVIEEHPFNSWYVWNR